MELKQEPNAEGFPISSQLWGRGLVRKKPAENIELKHSNNVKTAYKGTFPLLKRI
jgi:hypothetical protein